MSGVEFQAYDIALLPVLIGVVRLVIEAGLPKKYAPVVAIVLGVVIGVLYLADGNVEQGVLVGTALGLASVGLFSGAKNVAERIKE
jgi:uncharacterized membrane protein HdeD (DUF308 family)